MARVKKEVKKIRDRLMVMQDLEYRDFQSKLIPGVDNDYFIGVRTPELRKLAKELGTAEAPQASAARVFLADLPHKYFDENQLHAFIISLGNDFDETVQEVEAFLPYVNNWATCDQLSPRVFKKHRKELLSYIKKWIRSKDTYTVRFAIEMLMEHFLDEDFDGGYLQMVARVQSEEYYVNMMIAWYFATALAKHYDAAFPYIQERRLDRWTHNKAIQKSVESYRITPKQKEQLKNLRWK